MNHSILTNVTTPLSPRQISRCHEVEIDPNILNIWSIRGYFGGRFQWQLLLTSKVGRRRFRRHGKFSVATWNLIPEYIYSLRASQAFQTHFERIPIFFFFIENIYFNHIQWWAQPTQHLFLFYAAENLTGSWAFSSFSRVHEKQVEYLPTCLVGSASGMCNTAPTYTANFVSAFFLTFFWISSQQKRMRQIFLGGKGCFCEVEKKHDKKFAADRPDDDLKERRNSVCVRDRTHRVQLLAMCKCVHYAYSDPRCQLKLNYTLYSWRFLCHTISQWNFVDDFGMPAESRDMLTKTFNIY